MYYAMHTKFIFLKFLFSNLYCKLLESYGSFVTLRLYLNPKLSLFAFLNIPRTNCFYTIFCDDPFFF
jgi:hypothetical protein